VADALDPMDAGWKAEVREAVGGAAWSPTGTVPQRTDAAAQGQRSLATPRRAGEIRVARLQETYPRFVRHGDNEQDVAGGGNASIASS
jgi:hypothetical protein